MDESIIDGFSVLKKDALKESDGTGLSTSLLLSYVATSDFLLGNSLGLY